MIEFNKNPDFEKEILFYKDTVYAYCIKLTRDRNEADDLFQLTYLKALRFQDDFKPGNMKAWLYTITRNSYINFYRKRQESPEFVEYESQELNDGISTLMFLDDSLQDNLNSSISDEVLSAFNKIPERYRTVAILAYFEDWNYEQIADFLGIPVGTVRSKLHRAKDVLCNELKDYSKQYGYN